MADYVRVMISIAAQWRVVRAIGPAALALAGVPVAGPASPKRLPALPVTAPPVYREQRKGGPGTVQPKNGHKAWK